MKKLVFGLIATVMFSSISLAQDFDEIGLKHNVILKALLLQADSKVTKDNAFEFGQSLTNELFPEYKDTPAYRFADNTSPYKMLDELLSKKMISKDLYNKVTKDLVNTSNFKTYQEIQAYVETAKETASTLKENDSNLYLDFLSVMKHSSYFWDERGENGASYVPRVPAVSARINIWKYLACDAVGAIGGPASMAICSLCYGIAEWP